MDNDKGQKDSSGSGDLPPEGGQSSMPARKKTGLTIPLINKTLSIRTIVILAVLLPLIALLGIALTIRETNRPTFCYSCHEMDRYYDSWKNSPHKELQCVDCHISPGTENMVIHKAKSIKQIYMHFRGVKPGDIKGHVPDINCTRCHKESKELVVYHSLKITHKKHLTMGLKCVSCHTNVVHGSESDFLHAPPMATCITCHDGKKASNKCSICHVGEIERDRSPFGGKWIEKHKRTIKDSGEETCKGCHHPDYCKSCHGSLFPHPRDYESTPHIADAKKDEARCKRCHELKFCDACHTMKWEHPIEWVRTHVTEGEKDRKKCAACHTEDFCTDCHTKLAQHQTGFEKKHAVEAQQHPERCKTCHEKSYCLHCHEKTEPASHQGKNWIARHKIDASRKSASCSVCHKQDSCTRCHKTVRPATHDEKWRENHTWAAKQNQKACLVCHEKTYCDRCHTVAMPHAEQWKSTHGSRINEGFCQRCHTEKECAACHRSKKPASHGRTWQKSHASAMLAGRENCFACHTKDYCDRCHGLELPHPRNWGTGHKAAFIKQGTTCYRCHTKGECVACHEHVTPASHKSVTWKKDHKKEKGKELRCALCHPASGAQNACMTCHGGLEMPHADNYTVTHGKDSREKSSSCIKCHTRDQCLKCHQAMPPSNHKDEWKLAGHKQDALKNKNLCKACHDAGTCVKCHPEEKSKIK
jgi:nitrate/TMAO reductase-like tetraheme cytochrome c subunit